jgi:hypothetical protein
MERRLPPNHCPAAPPDQLRHGQAPPIAGEIPIAPPYYPDLRRMGAASGGWEQHQADGQQLGWEQQADGRSQLRRGDFNTSSIPIIPASGGREQDSPMLSWLESAAQGGQRRRIFPPNSAAGTTSNPYLDVCSGESIFQYVCYHVQNG